MLPGGCSISFPGVFPKTWRQASASCAKDWYIHYRFYDPIAAPQGRSRMIKGMNEYGLSAERRLVTERLLEDELDMLKQGWNPITGIYAVTEELGELNPYTPLMAALRIALKSCSCVPEMTQDMRNMLTWVELAAGAMHMQNMKVGDVRKRHIKMILEKCATTLTRYDQGKKKNVTVKWSNYKYNKYRAYLMVLFGQICEVDAIDMNPVNKDLKRKKSIVKKPVVLTPQERFRVDAVLRWFVPEFHRFVHIFFHSGSRTTEIIKLKGKDVDLDRQVFTRIVKKGRQYMEVETTIKDVALPYWKEVMQGCRRQDYVFSEGLVPGPVQIRVDQINRRWRTWVKRPLDIDKDFYKLKHLNTTETVEIIGDKGAARHNGQKGTAMVVKIYDVNRASREHEEIKTIHNPF